MSGFCYSGMKTIIFYLIKHFFKEYQFNLIAPLVNTFIFILIMSAINKYYSFNNPNDLYINFLIPGMVLAIVIQTSYNHLSQIIIEMKQIGSFNDYLISPLSRLEIYFSFIFSSIFVSLTVALINLIVLFIFSDYDYINFYSLFYYLTLTILIFSSIGAITGFLSYTWDVQSSVSNFFIVPISFLSGTFFSIDSLKQDWQFIFAYNPFYYLVNGFRSSFNKIYTINFNQDLLLIFILIITIILSMHIYKKGYRVIT